MSVKLSDIAAELAWVMSWRALPPIRRQRLLEELIAEAHKESVTAFYTEQGERDATLAQEKSGAAGLAQGGGVASHQGEDGTVQPGTVEAPEHPRPKRTYRRRRSKGGDTGGGSGGSPSLDSPDTGKAEAAHEQTKVNSPGGGNGHGSAAHSGDDLNPPLSLIVDPELRELERIRQKRCVDLTDEELAKLPPNEQRWALDAMAAARNGGEG